MQPGERIRDFRLKLGNDKKVSQQEFGERLGFKQGYISNLETGRQLPSRDFLLKLYEIYGLSENFILHGDLPEKEHNEEIFLSVGERRPEWILNPNHERRLPQNAHKRRLIDNVIKILDSGNKKVIKALRSNIDAFLDGIEKRELELNGGD